MLDVIYNEDCLEGMKRIPDGSVQCCVTSPPYFGLRDYGTASWQGGNDDCKHSKGTAASKKSTLKNDGRPNPGSNHYEHSVIVPYRHVCGKCGATRIDQQLGLESSPQAYVSKLVRLFREVRRVLKADGTLFLNLGDSYGDRKQLIGIPWRVAFALQADGWYLRQDIIWAKSNPMPESVRDRCTKAHEYVFLLSKSARYFFDADAISEQLKDKPHTRIGNASQHHSPGFETPQYTRRNKRSVWTVNAEPYPGAHFAVMPESLVEPCISAGSPVGGVVLDPFMGSGTVARVAYRLNRHYLGFELNAEYCRLAQQRLQHTQRQFQYGMPPELAEAV